MPLLGHDEHALASQVLAVPVRALPRRPLRGERPDHPAELVLLPALLELAVREQRRAELHVTVEIGTARQLGFERIAALAPAALPKARDREHRERIGLAVGARALRAVEGVDRIVEAVVERVQAAAQPPRERRGRVELERARDRCAGGARVVRMGLGLGLGDPCPGIVGPGRDQDGPRGARLAPALHRLQRHGPRARDVDAGRCATAGGVERREAGSGIARGDAKAGHLRGRDGIAGDIGEHGPGNARRLSPSSGGGQRPGRSDAFAGRGVRARGGRAWRTSPEQRLQCRPQHERTRA
jgi:hypothetical protein